MAVRYLAVYDPPRGLVPATGVDAEMADSLIAKRTYTVTVTSTRQRSVRQHRLLFALIKIVRDNTPIEPALSSDTLLDVIKLKTGHVRVVTMLTGEVLLFPASIAFENMPQDEFNPWFRKAVEVMLREFLPGLTVVRAQQELLLMLEDKR